MNFIKCKKCGEKLISTETKTQDLYEHKMELEKEIVEIKRMLHELGEKRSRKKEVHEIIFLKKQEYRAKTSEIETVKHQISQIEKQKKLEKQKSHDRFLIQAIKQIIDKDSFQKAVDIAHRLEREYEINKDYEFRKVYGNETDITTKKDHQNSEGYTDSTSYLALKNIKQEG